MDGVKEARATLAAEAMGKMYDPKDETVRGSIPIFNLKNQRRRQDFLRKIKPLFSDDKERDMDWGVLLMIVLDFEPFNLVNRFV